MPNIFYTFPLLTISAITLVEQQPTVYIASSKNICEINEDFLSNYGHEENRCMHKDVIPV